MRGKLARRAEETHLSAEVCLRKNHGFLHIIPLNFGPFVSV